MKHEENRVEGGKFLLRVIIPFKSLKSRISFTCSSADFLTFPAADNSFLEGCPIKFAAQYQKGE